jgi:hypothetical protein
MMVSTVAQRRSFRHLPVQRVSLADVARRAQRLEIGQHRLSALRPGHDVIDVKRHAGIFRRAGAAHPAEAVVADQHGGSQTEADSAAGGALLSAGAGE